MKFGLMAMEFTEGDTEHNLGIIKKSLEQYSNQGLDLLLFGEAFLQGFDALSFSYEEDRHKAISTESTVFRTLQDKARECNLGVSFGYYELESGLLFSSQAFIGGDGQLVHNFRRISQGWKEPGTDSDLYKEGPGFATFLYQERKLAIGLCGDLWDYGPAMKKIEPEIVLWPVYMDYSLAKWEEEKHEYAHQAGGICPHVLLVNSICAGEDRAKGGAAYFREGRIAQELPGGQEGILIVEV